MNRVLLAILLLVPFITAVPAAAQTRSLRSPDGRVGLTLALDEDHRLRYAIAFRGQAVIERSALGMTVDGVNLGEGVRIGPTDLYKTNTTYAWRGVHATAVDRSNAARFPLTHVASGLAYTLEARAYNDGIAFRFIVPGDAAKSRVPDEATTFRLPAGSTVWFHDFEGHYEGVHSKKAIEEVKAGEWAAPPLTLRLAGGAGYGAITEGGLRAYAGMGLQAGGDREFHARLGHAHPASYPFRLRYKEDVERMTVPAPVTGTISTPWRVVLVGADLNTLVNSDIIHNVAPPPDRALFPQGIKTAWLKPGRAVWKYLDGGENTLEEMHNFSRLAGELGFEYNVIEGFWRKWSMQELKGLVEYSRERGVGILLWKHSKELRDPAERRKFFDLCHEAGVAGAKLDFYDHEAKEVVELYEAALRDAAERRMIINFHGANKPTGESRTWPNEMTREGIRGMESRRIQRAGHDATLPFTRMLAGHADYTPMVFSERRNDTTWAHQIASAAIFTSPLLVYGGHPKSMLENPAVEVIKAIPSVWDETIALAPSEIGDVAVFARRRGQEWFVAVMNGPAARSFRLPLSFLGGGKYKAVLVRDSDEGTAAVQMEKADLGRRDSIEVRLQAGGGFVAHFRK